MDVFRKLWNILRFNPRPNDGRMEEFVSRIEDEYQHYHDSILALDKEAIFDLAGEIRFYSAVHEFVLSDNPLSIDILSALETLDEIIPFLFDYYQNVGGELDDPEIITEIFANALFCPNEGVFAS